MEKFVLNKKQVKHLQKLGLDMSDAKLWWCAAMQDSHGEKITKKKYFLVQHPGYQQRVGLMRFEYIPTYTLEEIWRKLPEVINVDGCEYRLVAMKDMVGYVNSEHGHVSDFSRISILYSAYEALCWVLENNLLINNI